MKRIFAILLALLMILSLAACGEEKRVSKKDNDAETPATTVATTPATSGAVVATKPTQAAPVETQSSETDDNTVFNTDDFAVTITSVDFSDDYYGVIINLKAENKTTDESFTISTDGFFVNGLQTDGACYINIEAGEIKTEKAYVTRDFLDMADIDTVNGFEVTFTVDDEDYDEVGRQTITYGEDLKYNRPAQSTDQVLMDTKDVKVTLVDSGWAKYSGYEMVFYVENFTDKNVYIDAENLTVDGKECTIYLGVWVAPGYSTFEQTSLYSTSLEEIGIEENAAIKEIKFDLAAMDWDSYRTINEATVTIKP